MSSKKYTPGATPSRRQFMAGSMALGAGSALSGAALANADEISSQSLKEAGKLFAVDYSDAENRQMLDTIDGQLEQLRAIRDLKYPNMLAPATTFDPRLPGVNYTRQEDRVSLSPTHNLALPNKAVDIAFAPIHHQAHWIRSGQLSAVRLTEIYLERIQKHGAELECFITVTADLALSQARKLDAESAKGKNRGPLHGIPYGLKDLFDTKDIKTTWGAEPYKDRVPDQDAKIVELLRDAGAILLGKTTCGALAWGDVWYGGKTRNPWNIAEGSSGSSAGSASATGAGLVGFSIGTETYGSIVSPSHRCGTTGLRPTFGRISRAGGMALCWTLDKVGPICRAVEDTAMVLSALNGPDAEDSGSIPHGFDYDYDLDLPALKVGYDPKWFEGDQATDVDRNALKVMKTLGVQMKEVSLPDLPYSSLLLNLNAESAAAFEELTLSGRDDLMKRQIANAWPNHWRQARFISAVDYVQMDRLRRTIMQNMHTLFEEVDLIISPNFADNLLLITNYTGHPCLTLRGGFEERSLDGVEGSHILPHNFSLMGGLYTEGKLCALGRIMEEKLGVRAKKPPQFA